MSESRETKETKVGKLVECWSERGDIQYKDYGIGIVVGTAIESKYSNSPPEYGQLYKVYWLGEINGVELMYNIFLKTVS